MSTISPADLLKLRNDHPHSCKFYLSFLKPTLVYCGQVTGSYSIGDREITVTDISGSLSNCIEGNTIYVGTSSGDCSISKRRFRSVTGNVITLDENSVIWGPGQYITIYDNHEIFPKYPYITDSDPYTFYKDRDIAYTNQNVDISPVAIAGPPKVGFLSGGFITFALDASDSYAVAPGATIVSNAWSCSGGTIASPTSETTTITFTSAGQYWLKLLITDSNGTTQSTYRRIYVHERTGSNAPCMDFEIVENPSGSFENSGWTMKVKVMDGAELSEVQDGSQVVLWSESYYDGTEHCIGDSGNIRFVGYMLSEIITTPLAGGYVEFDLGTVDKVLDSSNMFSISLEESNSSDTWYRFPTGTLTVARAIHHLWKWHSTLLEACDVFLPMSNTKTMPACDDMENGTLLTLANWTYENGIFAKACCDKIGRMHLEEDCIMLPDASQNALPEVMEILPIDRRGDSDIQYIRNSESQCSSVVASGVAMIAGTATPLLSIAPGEVPDVKGQENLVVERLVLSDQADLNFISGRLYAQRNREILEIRFSLAGNYPVDVVPQEWFNITLPSDKRGTSFSDVQLVCRTVTDVIDTKSGTVYPECIFEMRVSSVDGIADTYPTTEDPNGPPEPYVVPPFTPAPPYTTPVSGLFGMSANLGDGSADLDSGSYRHTEVPYNCIIDRVILLSTDTGDVEVDIRKTTFALAPPTAADSIVASSPPEFASAQKYFDAVLSGWTRLLNKGDIIEFVVVNSSGIKSLLVAISGRKL